MLLIFHGEHFDLPLEMATEPNTDETRSPLLFENAPIKESSARKAGINSPLGKPIALARAGDFQ